MRSDEQGRRGRPRGRPTRKPAKRRDEALEARIEELQSANGLTRTVATQVALGRVDLNDVLTKMVLQAKVESLMRRHQLSRALATQIAMDQADLQAVLFKRRMADHLSENAERSVLVTAHASGATLALGLHGHRVVEGKITELDRYEFELTSKQGAERIHKVQAKWAVDVKSRKKALRGQTIAPERKGVAREPIWKPQDRYCCSNKRLFSYVDRQVSVEVTLLEGGQWRGVPRWAGRYEFGLEVRKGVELVVFRHALEKLAEV
jgi:sRNA-binding regulator protein Hfq